MFNIGPLELMVILIVALIVVGPKRLPEVGRTIGKAARELRKVQDDVRDTIRLDFDADAEPPQTRGEFKPIIHPEAQGAEAADGDAAEEQTGPENDGPAEAE